MMHRRENSRGTSLAIVGCTGAVGQECCSILESRATSFDSNITLFASPRSAGQQRTLGGKTLTIRPLERGCFDDIDIAIFAAGSAISREWAAIAVDADTYVIDNSSAFRMHAEVPLIVPEVNGDTLNNVRERPCIIANPNCSTIIALLVVTPLHRVARITRMVISTYQAVSGAGAAAMHELEAQARDYAAGRALSHNIFPQPILFNLFSHNSSIGPDGCNEEERKLSNETHKIWNDGTIAITATCVRVPVLRCHAEAINLSFASPLDETRARDILAGAAGVSVIDDRENNQFPEPRLATGQDDIFVGRIRNDPSQPPGMGLNLFVCGDQLRKGAALNAIQIAEMIAEKRVVSGCDQNRERLPDPPIASRHAAR
ncbi:MAG: aspartate-semialdehyde dehydrogenase [Phycisphaerales bacterium]